MARRWSKTRAAVVIGAMALATHIPAAWAQVRDPLDFPAKQYLFLLGIALLGGIVSWYAKVRSGYAQAWNLMHLIGELATSAFAGLMAFLICTHIETSAPVTAALVGVAGHMGARAITVFENWAARRFSVDRSTGQQ